MRKVFLFTLLFSLLQSSLFAQEKKDQKTTVTPAAIPAPAADSLPYQKYPKLPAFNILEMDSVTIFNTYNIPAGKKTILLFFSPDCGHCQMLMRNLIKNMDSLKDVQFYMMTVVHSMTTLRNFYNEYHLADYKNIHVVGRDYEFFYIPYYGIKNFPDMALYDEHKKLIKLFEGDIPLTQLFPYVR